VSVRQRRDASGEAGFSLLEVVIGMSLSGVLIVAVLGMLLRTADVAGQNLRRSTAANLLSGRIELARGTQVQNLPDGTQVSNATVGDVRYTITQDTRYVSDSEDTNMCGDNTGNLLYKLVRVTVTWPDMEAVKPVTGETLRAVGVGSDGSDVTTGTVVVTVRDTNNDLVPGATVTLGQDSDVYRSATTGPDGCAVFVEVPPNWYNGDAAGGPGTTTDGQSGHYDWTEVKPGDVNRQTVFIAPPPDPTPPSSNESGGTNSDGSGSDGSGWNQDPQAPDDQASDGSGGSDDGWWTGPAGGDGSSSNDGGSSSDPGWSNDPGPSQDSGGSSGDPSTSGGDGGSTAPAPAPAPAPRKVAS
jgi:Tfp pilus assembly protein FimT